MKSFFSRERKLKRKAVPTERATVPVGQQPHKEASRSSVSTNTTKADSTLSESTMSYTENAAVDHAPIMESVASNYAASGSESMAAKSSTITETVTPNQAASSRKSMAANSAVMEELATQKPATEPATTLATSKYPQVTDLQASTKPPRQKMFLGLTSSEYEKQWEIERDAGKFRMTWVSGYFKDGLAYYDSVFTQVEQDRFIQFYCFHELSYERLQERMVVFNREGYKPVFTNAFCDDVVGSQAKFTGLWIIDPKNSVRRRVSIRVTEEDLASLIEKQDDEGFDIRHISAWNVRETVRSANRLERLPAVLKTYYNITWEESPPISSYYFDTPRMEVHPKIVAFQEQLYRPYCIAVVKSGMDVNYSIVHVPCQVAGQLWSYGLHWTKEDILQAFEENVIGETQEYLTQVMRLKIAHFGETEYYLAIFSKDGVL